MQRWWTSWAWHLQVLSQLKTFSHFKPHTLGAGGAPSGAVFQANEGGVALQTREGPSSSESLISFLCRWLGDSWSSPGAWPPPSFSGEGWVYDNDNELGVADRIEGWGDVGFPSFEEGRRIQRGRAGDRQGPNMGNWLTPRRETKTHRGHTIHSLRPNPPRRARGQTNLFLRILPASLFVTCLWCCVVHTFIFQTYIQTRPCSLQNN